MVLFVLRKLILQTRMCTRPMRLDAWFWSKGLLSYFMCANSEGSGETARMRRLAWAFAGRHCDKYQNVMSRLIYVFVLLFFRFKSSLSSSPIMDYIKKRCGELQDSFMVLCIRQHYTRFMVSTKYRYEWCLIWVTALLDHEFSNSAFVLGSVLRLTQANNLRGC